MDIVSFYQSVICYIVYMDIVSFKQSVISIYISSLNLDTWIYSSEFLSVCYQYLPILFEHGYMDIVSFYQSVISICLNSLNMDTWI